MKRAISTPSLISGCEQHNVEMKRSKSDSNFQGITLKRKQLKSIVFLRRKLDTDGRVIANGVQDIQFAQDILDSHSLWKTLALTVLMMASIEKDEEKVQRIRLIIGTMVLLEFMKRT